MLYGSTVINTAITVKVLQQGHKLLRADRIVLWITVTFLRLSTHISRVFITLFTVHHTVFNG